MSSSRSIKKNQTVAVSKMALAYNGLLLATCLVAIALSALQSTGKDSLVECQEQLTVESRQQKDNDDLAETIKYLENLDTFFSQIARPRFGRSEYKQARLSAQPFPASLMSGSGNSAEPQMRNYGSLMNLVNSRLARRYRDSEGVPSV